MSTHCTPDQTDTIQIDNRLTLTGKVVTFADFPADYCDQIRRAAHAAAAAGYHVLPLVPGDKKPTGKSNGDGSRKGTTDPRQIDEWWPANTPPERTNGLAIRTGCGLGVLDVDVKDFTDGVNPHAAMIDNLWADMPIRINTPRGGNGEHIPFHNDGSMATEIKTGGRGIDLIATKKNYVVAPPTWLITKEPTLRSDGTPKKDGHPGGVYTYRDGSRTYGEIQPDELPPLHPDLLEVIDGWKEKKGRPQKVLAMPTLSADVDMGEVEAYVVERCRKYLAKLEHHQGGQRGHCKLIHAACVIAGDYGLRGAEGRQLFEEWNAASTHPDGPEDAHQMERKWMAGLAKTEGKPSNKRAECLLDWDRKHRRETYRKSAAPAHASQRVEVMVYNGQEAHVANEVTKILTCRDVPIFNQDGKAVVVHQGDNTSGQSVNGKAKWTTAAQRTRVEVAKPGWIRKRISENCELQTTKVDTETGEETVLLLNTPQWLPDTMQASPDGMRRLNGVALGPVIGIDESGRLLNELGFDAESGLYLASPVAGLRIPERPTLEDAQQAERKLWHLVKGFPWRNADLDYPRWLCLLFTAAMRHQLKQVPMGLITAPAAGSGKSTLACVIGYILHGQAPTNMSWLDDSTKGSNDEMRKRLANLCQAAETLLVLDDLPHNSEINSPELRNFLTAEAYYDRLMGQNGGAMAGGPQRCQIIATGNACLPHADLAQRVLVINLEPVDPFHRSKDPAQEWPDVGDAATYAINHRTELLAAVLTVVRAYRQAGDPQPRGEFWSGCFEPWVNTVCTLVRWLTGKDPLHGLRQEWEQNDSESANLTELVVAWHDLLGGAALTPTQILGRTFSAVNAADPDTQKMREIVSLMVPTRDGNAPTAKRLGHFLRGFANRPVNTPGGNMAIKTAHNSETGKGVLYWVSKIAPTAAKATNLHPPLPTIVEPLTPEIGKNNACLSHTCGIIPDEKSDQPDNGGSRLVKVGNDTSANDLPPAANTIRKLCPPTGIAKAELRAAYNKTAGATPEEWELNHQKACKFGTHNGKPWAWPAATSVEA